MIIRAFALLIATGACAQTLRIGVFGIFRPAQVWVSGTSSLAIQAGAECRTLEAGAVLRCALDGSLVACGAGTDVVRGRDVTIDAKDGHVLLSVPGKLKRRFSGVLTVRSSRRALTASVAMDLETAVASTVAAEADPDTPIEALRAQAIAARSYYVAERARHSEFDFCDTTHCQFLREPPGQGSAAAEAAETTRSLVLTSNGVPVAGFLTASCGGSTRTPAAAEGGHQYPYFSVDCPYCRRNGARRCSYCTRTEGAWPNRRGSGAGHGIGLCQNGAAGMASEGAGFRAILNYYFPNTRITAASGY